MLVRARGSRMEVQPYPLQRVLFVTITGDASRRVAICVHESDTIADVRAAVQHALRSVPDFPQEATITSIECEFEGEDYVLSDPIRVNQIFGTGTAKLKVQVGSFQGAGEQVPTVRDKSPSRTVARSPANSPFPMRASPLSKTVATVSGFDDGEVIGNSHQLSLAKQQVVALGSSEDDVEMIEKAHPLSGYVPVPSINALNNLVDDDVISRPHPLYCKSLFQSIGRSQCSLNSHPVHTVLPESQDADITAGNLLTHLSACPSLQRETTTCELVEKGRNSALDVPELPIREPAGEPVGPFVMSLEEDFHEEAEQGNYNAGVTPQKKGDMDVSCRPHKQGNQDISSSPQKRGSENVSGTRNQDLRCTPQKQGTPRGENAPDKSPQKLNRFLFAAEHHVSPGKPTGSQDTYGSCETGGRRYTRPSKRKLGAEVNELLAGFVNGGSCSPSSRRRGSKGGHVSSAMQSLEQEPSITLNDSERTAEERNGIPTEAPDTMLATETRGHETADGKRHKKRKSKRNKQETADKQPTSNQEPENAIVTLGDQDPGLLDHNGDAHGKEGFLIDEPPPLDIPAARRVDGGEEHTVEIVVKKFTPNDTNGVCESGHPESTPTLKKRRRLTKKHQNDGQEESPLAQPLSPRREGSTREGPKVSLCAFVAEEHLPKPSEGPQVETQLDTTGQVVSYTEQGHIPEIVQDGRLAGTPVRSSPRHLKKRLVETAMGNKVGAPKENQETQTAESAGENNRPGERPVKKKRASGKRKKKGPQVRNRQTESLKKETEQEESDSHAHSPNLSSKVANDEEELSDGTDGGTVIPRNSKKRKEKDKSTEKKQVEDGDQARVPCRYKLLGCQKDYQYKTSAYYLHCRSCVYKGDCPSP